MEESSEKSTGTIRFCIFHRPKPAISTQIKLKEGTNHGYKATEYPDSLGRRYRYMERQPLQQGHDGVPDAEHRPGRRRRRYLHRLLRPAELHRWTCSVHHWPESAPHRLDQSRNA